VLIVDFTRPALSAEGISPLPKPNAKNYKSYTLMLAL
jgi:hypothetical protein